MITYSKDTHKYMTETTEKTIKGTAKYAVFEKNIRKYSADGLQYIERILFLKIFSGSKDECLKRYPEFR